MMSLLVLLPLAENITLKEVGDEVKGWWCIPAKAQAEKAILYIHDGAYFMCTVKAFRGIASTIAQLTDIAVFVVEYPLSTEAPFSGAPDAVLAAYHWLVSQGFTAIVIMGDSAGGGLTLTTLQQLTNDASTVKPIAGVAFSPWTDLAFTGKSWADATIVDALIKEDALKACAELYVGSADASVLTHLKYTQK